MMNINFLDSFIFNVDENVIQAFTVMFFILVGADIVLSIVSYFTFKKPLIPLFFTLGISLYSSVFSFINGNILYFFGGLSGIIISAYMLRDEYKHMQKVKEEEGKNYAQIEDYGHKDHYLYKSFKKVFSTILVVFIAFALYFSIFIIFLQSINSSKLVTEWKGATFKWYIEMFTNRSLNNAILRTFTISILATLISTLLGTLFAIGIFYSSKKVREHILLINNFPLLNADIVTGISLMLIFSLFIAIDPYFFGWKTMLLAHLFFCMPYVILNVLSKLKDLDKNIVDASLDLGIKPFKTIWKVIVPAAKAGIFSGAILAFTMSFDDFVISYYTSGNGYDNLSIWIYSSIGRKSLTPVVYSFSILVVVVCIVLLLLSTLFKKKKKGGK